MDDDLGCLADGPLVSAIARRRAGALEEVYRRHSPAVFGVARRVTGSQALAEEVLQEVFLRLWSSPARFDPERGTLRAYLLIEGHARAVDLLRRDTSRRDREDRHARLSPDDGYDLEHEVWDLVLAEHLQEALDSLPAGEREAIELAYWGGHTYREVARILEQPEGTVKSRIRLGLLRMRDRLVAEDLGRDGA